MIRLIRLFVLAAWLVGAVIGGGTVQPEARDATGDDRIVAVSDWAKFTVQTDQVVLAVGTEAPRWRTAVPLPPVLQHWLGGTDEPARDTRRTSVQWPPVTPL